MLLIFFFGDVFILEGKERSEIFKILLKLWTMPASCRQAQHWRPVSPSLHVRSPPPPVLLRYLYIGVIHNHALRLRSTILTAVLWNIWKKRNANVFRGELFSVLHCIADDLLVWSYCCKDPSDKNYLIDWGHRFRDLGWYPLFFFPLCPYVFPPCTCFTTCIFVHFE